MLQSRDEIRQTYFTAWKKHHTKELLTDVEQQIVTVLIEHPEYHAYFSDLNNQQKEYIPELNEVNPYLHCGLHIAIKEQIRMNAPAGVLDVYAALMQKYQDNLHVEHLMMDCLAEAIWEMQRSGREPDMQAYLERLRGL